MSDDLVKRLREDQPVTQDMASTMQCALQDAAAERIEELQAQRNFAQRQVVAAEAKLARAVGFIEDLTGCEWPYNEDAKRILAELSSVSCANLKGERDE
ncbi:MAG: hypothetical protein GY820_34540 [Gammaproteobacteria bacterium]|nr:hypothetical protein [Gammaproteobacteria bacterium]